MWGDLAHDFKYTVHAVGASHCQRRRQIVPLLGSHAVDQPCQHIELQDIGFFLQVGAADMPFQASDWIEHPHDFDRISTGTVFIQFCDGESGVVGKGTLISGSYMPRDK